MPKLESVEAVLVRCNLVKNDYQHASKVLFTFVQGINILPHSLKILNTINTFFFFFFFFEVLFTDQVSKALEIEDNVQFDNYYWVALMKMRYSTEPRYRRYIKVYGFLSFVKKFGDMLKN